MIIDSPIISGSYTGTGSFDQKGNIVITGSLTVNGPIVGALTGSVDSASFATTAISASFSSTSISSSFASTATSASFASTATSASFADSTISASFASTATSASFADSTISASFATTSLTSSFANNLTVAGTITAQTLNVQQITSSVIYSSGSNVFGNSISNTQQFTGSVLISGSINTTPGIQITGDGVNDMIQAIRAGNTRFVVKNAVNAVGINTTTPNNPLTVNGGADFVGNVGIGITSPGATLDVKFDSSSTDITSSGASSLRLLNSQAANTNNFHTGIWFRLDNGINNKNGYIKLINDATNAVGDFAFILTQSGNEFERVRIKGNGNVGIGTTSPVAELQVDKTSDVTIAMSNSNSVTSGNRGQLSWYNSSVSTVAIIRAAAITDNVGTELQFHIRPAGGSVTQAMTLNASGNLSIGNTNNTYKLDVTGPDGSVGTIKWANAGGRKSGFLYSDSAGVAIYDTNLNDAGIYLAGNIQMDFRVNGSQRMLINSSGNVGIGTTSPSTLLNIEKNIAGTDLGDGILFKLKNSSTTTNTRSGITFGNIDGVGGSLVIQSAILKNASTGEYDMIWDLYGGTAGWKEGLLYLDSNPGNVGINTSTPTTKLSVNSGISSSSSNVISIMQNTNGATKDAAAFGVAIQNGGEATNAADLYISTATGGALVERMRITSGGNVGIGTTSPAEKLTINSGGANNSTNYAKKNIVVNSGFVTGYTGNAIQSLLAGYDGSIYGTDFGYGYDGNGYTLMFSTNDDLSGNPIERMRITSGGNVGIGTTSPSNKLDIQSANGTTYAATPQLRIGGGGVNNSYAQILFSDNALSDGKISYFPAAAAADRYFSISARLTESDFVIRGNGNVGIGTTSPGATLDVAGNIYVSGAVSGRLFPFDTTVGAGADATTTIIDAGSTSGFRSRIKVAGGSATDANTIIFYTGSSEHMRIIGSGIVKIGTIADLVASNRKLEVLGACAISAKSTGTGGEPVLEGWQSATAGDNVFATFITETSYTLRGSIDYNRASNVTRYNTTSDANLKNLIGDADLQKSIDILKSTKIREYSWKDDKDNKPQIGVIAQELYETYKGAVSKGSDDELFGTEDYKTWGVDKTAFTFHLIAGWQKHEQLINDLQAQIKELKAEIDELKSK